MSYHTYVFGRNSMMMDIPRLGSFFRVYWRMLNIDGFYGFGDFVPVSYRFILGARS